MPPAATSALERKVEAIAASLEGDDGLRVRMALLERAVGDLVKEVQGLREDLSDQGKPPPVPPPSNPPLSNPPTPTPEAGRSGSWTLKIAPGSGRELAYLVIAVASLLGGPAAGWMLADAAPVAVAAPAPVGGP